MKVLIFVFVATVLEATGDAVVRVALRQPVLSLAVRIAIFLMGAALLTLYGTSLNLAPVDFATVTGIYVALLFMVFQVTNYVFFHAAPTRGVLTGGTLIVAGGLVVFFWR